MTRPPSLTFGICAPSSYADPANFAQGVARLEQMGQRVIVHPQARGRLGNTQSAGTIEEKCQALYDLYEHPDVDIVMMARGGNFALHLLDVLDFDRLKETAKPFLGFSDATALLNSLNSHNGTVNFHGPGVTSLRDDYFKATQFDQMIQMLAGQATDLPLTGAVVERAGIAKGRLLGGNLSVFQFLLNTRHCPDLSGAILLLEDIGEELNQMDRVLLYFRRLGIFDRLGGLIFGQFTDMKDTGRPFGFGMEEIIRTHTSGLDIPILTHAPTGHIGMPPVWPIGATVQLDARQGTPTLALAKEL